MLRLISPMRRQLLPKRLIHHRIISKSFIYQHNTYTTTIRPTTATSRKRKKIDEGLTTLSKFRIENIPVVPSSSSIEGGIEHSYQFGDKTIQLNEEQQGVVFEDINRNILILASAGSGKTTTILCRIYHLVQSGVPEKSITLTTFTRDAAHDMKQKLNLLFGKTTRIEVGTIDSIAKKYIKKYKDEIYSHESVKEYGLDFLTLLRNPGTGSKICDNKRYLFVDEFQDIDDTQFSIIQEYYKRGVIITGIGDDAQNIYSFRGSNIEHILNFKFKFENSIIHQLSVNYRSTQAIIDVANASIEKNTISNIPKVMVSYLKETHGSKPTVHYYKSKFSQSHSVADIIEQYIKHGVPPHSICVLCYSNKSLYAVEEIFTHREIPHTLLEKENEYTNNSNRATFNTHERNTVCLSTIHKAKGMEWDIVFLLDLSDEYFPFSKRSQEDIEEQRRMFYVAVTRAKHKLHLSFRQMMTTGTSQTTYASRFISEVPSTLFEFFNVRKEQLMDVSTSEFEDDTLSVTSLIRQLDGQDIKLLRDKNIIPNSLQFKEKRIIDDFKFSYDGFIQQKRLFSDFGIYIDTLLCRMIGERKPDSLGLYSYNGYRAICSLRVNSEIYGTYKKYASKLDIVFRTGGSVPDFLKTIPLAERPAMKYIITELESRAAFISNVNIADLSVISKKFLPETFEEKMSAHLKQFGDEKKSWRQVIDDIWEVSKCESIVKERRRRLLYVDISSEQLMHYSPLYENIEKQYIPFLMDLAKSKIMCHPVLRLLNGVHGELDLLINDDTVVDIKCSLRKDLDMDWILQLFCYAHLCRENGAQVNKIAILNPLQGMWFEADISDWDHGKELIDIMLNKKFGQI
jgi:hypothetical protein